MNLKLPIDKGILTLAFHKPFDMSNENGRALERQRRIALTAFTTIILRVLNMIIPLITLKITYDYLNEEVYGLWSAVTTFFGLFAFSDLGLGNGLQTKLSHAYGRDDIVECRKIISNTYLMLLSIGIFLLVLFLLLFPFVNWGSLMNAKDSETLLLVSSIVFVIVISKILAIPVTIIQRTQLALQEGYLNNYWGIFGAFLSVVGIILVVKLDLGKVILLGVSSFIPIIISLFNMFFFFHVRRKELKISLKLFDYDMIKKLLSLGILFSVLSILMTVGLSMDTFIVARTCSLSEAGSYSIIYKVAAIFSAVISIFSAPLWGANGEAIARGDIKWVKDNTRRMSYIMSGLAVFLSIIGLCLAKPIFRIWLGNDFQFSFPALFWLCCMQVMLSFVSPYFMVLNACGIVKKQIMIFLIYTPFCFAIKYYLALKWGIAMIPMVGSILYLLVVVISIYVISIKKLNEMTPNMCH